MLTGFQCFLLKPFNVTYKKHFPLLQEYGKRKGKA